MRAARDEGVAAFKAGDYYAAATLFERALAAGEPEAWALQSNLSAARRLNGDAAGALRAALSCVEQKPDWSKAHFRCGEALMDLNRASEAVKHFQTAARLEPSVFVRKRLSEASAKAAVSEVQTREEDQSKQMVRSSTGGVQSQPELAALELMNKPVKEQTDQELLVTTMNRGCALMGQGDIPTAIDIFSKVVRAAPLAHSALANLGVCYHILGQNEVAIDWFKRAIQVKGDFAPFHRKIGISLELTAQTAEAERAYRRCLELDPRDMPTHQDLAIMIAIKGARVRDAIRHIKGVEDYHKDVFLPYFLGYLLLMAGPENLREAHHNLRLAVQNHRPMWASCNHLLTFTSLAMGDAQSAAKTKEIFHASLRDVETFHNDAATVNNKLDLPQWRLLDDKVMLNELMGGSNPTHERVVPRGFRLPQQYSQLREAAAAAPTARWMLKKGVAHGGNGNRLLAADLDDEDELEGCSDHVVQRYIHNPLLIDKLKFHLRLYVVILATAPVLSAFICRDGLMLFAVEEYEALHGSSTKAEDASFQHRHITNQGFNSKHAKYKLPSGGGGDQVVDGHTRNLHSLRAHLSATGRDWTGLWAAIKRSTAATLAAAATHLQTPQRECDPATHSRLLIPKVLGYDFLVDDQLTPWLMEVNRAPALGHRLEVDRTIKTTLTRDAWTLAMALMPQQPLNPAHKAPPSQFGCLEALECPSPAERLAALAAGVSHAPVAAVRGSMDDIDTDSDEEG